MLRRLRNGPPGPPYTLSRGLTVPRPMLLWHPTGLGRRLKEFIQGEHGTYNGNNLEVVTHFLDGYAFLQAGGTRVDIDSAAGLIDGLANFTIMAWCVGTAADFGCLVGMRDAGAGHGIFLGQFGTGDNIQFRVQFDSDASLNGTSGLFTKAVSHVVVARALNGTKSVFIDGTQDATTQSYTGTLDTGGGAAKIGVRHTGSGAAYGDLIGTVAIWPVGLTDLEIRILSNTQTQWGLFDQSIGPYPFFVPEAVAVGAALPFQSMSLMGVGR